MAFQVTQDATVDPPRERVWAYLADFARHTEWSEPKHQLRIQPPRREAARMHASDLSRIKARLEQGVAPVVVS